jgi:hypothetical protein
VLADLERQLSIPFPAGANTSFTFILGVRGIGTSLSAVVAAAFGL